MSDATSKSKQKSIQFKTCNDTPRKLLSIPPSPFLEKLGYGTGVNVWKLSHSPNSVKSPWAIKNVRKCVNKELSDKYQSLLTKEANILRSLDHENIIGFRGYLKSEDGRNCLAMEVGGESLGDLLEKRFENDLGPFPPDIIIKVAYSIAKALNYLHNEKNILHGDIKPYNVVIKNNFEDIKLCDFGVSIKLNDENITEKYVGTPIYSAPECIKGDKKTITEKSDIFSFGLILWEMIALFPPHTEDLINKNESALNSDDSLYTHVSDSEIEENYGTRPLLPPCELGSEYKYVLELFYACTEQDPDKRPSASSIIDYINMINKTNT
ncbi:mitogen-activated protein kinase ERK-A, putative [Pediculus humanus corporis]|uniref:mitogen-activated protein kinase kinase n=1 Tax=Pediculus humanus subsp. corporis TaxID=121224 RepID=E0V8X5_PEDHC|nr:mitogen-activated protein kinase ERK-A, putative [Pediculus humanus corporis]EEB09831.1 mitogen-activated protein kinase ERK-A, putative [Pediculus humanus corporis]